MTKIVKAYALKHYLYGKSNVCPGQSVDMDYDKYQSLKALGVVTDVAPSPDKLTEPDQLGKNLLAEEKAKKVYSKPKGKVLETASKTGSFLKPEQIDPAQLTARLAELEKGV